ncbi:protoglobin domain-containing protein [Bremerella sp. JC817]|uniref:protoglobin domain-containing protein n=1 Tax=Bremerella sp. JC817 TaxID=3231756 RepID=UPI003457483A
MSVPSDFHGRFEDLKRYIAWSDADDACSEELLRRLEPYFEPIVQDFYDEIRKHRAASRVITGGEKQIKRLQASLRLWLVDTLLAKHDGSYVDRRSKIGQQHVEIGLDQVYVNAAFSRIRGTLNGVLCRQDDLPFEERIALHQSLNRRLDLDLAIMSDAYQTEYQFRQIPVDHARLKQQKHLALLSRDALAGESLDVLYDQAVAHLMETLQGDCAEYLEFHPADSSFRLRSAAGWTGAAIDDVIGLRKPESYYEFVCSYKECIGIIDHDLRTDLDFPPLLREQRVVSSLQVAVRNEGQIYGVIGVHFHNRRQFQASDCDFLVSMANVIANAVHRKGIESQRQQSEHQLRRLIERLPAGAVYVAGGQLQVNQAVESMTGHARAELATLADWEQLTIVEEQERVEESAAKSPEGKIVQSEVRIRRPDGEERIISQLKFRSAIDEIWLLHDITEMEEQRRQQLQAERLAAIGQMITGLAHESRNALQRIQACTEMLELEFQPESQEMKLIGRLQQAQDDLQLLFDEVRNYAAPIVLETKPSDLAVLCRRAWEQTEPQRRCRETTIQIDGMAEVPFQADEFRLVQVFRNLLENSLAATPDPLVVTLLFEKSEDGQVRVTYQDNGPGFDENIAKRMLDPFFTTKTKGSGLGMAIASRIVEAHKGQIQPISQPGCGAKFVMMFLGQD